MSYKDNVLLIYSSFYFLISIKIEWIIYENTKKDNSMNWLFYSIIIFRRLDKYNIIFLNAFPCFTLGEEALIILSLRGFKCL